MILGMIPIRTCSGKFIDGINIYTNYVSQAISLEAVMEFF
jgi:hypothetical protein